VDVVTGRSTASASGHYDQGGNLFFGFENGSMWSIENLPEPVKSNAANNNR
jgi:hypothetical protein